MPPSCIANHPFAPAREICIGRGGRRLSGDGGLRDRATFDELPEAAPPHELPIADDVGAADEHVPDGASNSKPFVGRVVARVVERRRRDGPLGIGVDWLEAPSFASLALPWIIMLIVLVVRPYGLFGTRQVQRL